MDNFETIQSLTEKNNELKQQLEITIAELNNLKTQINESKQKTKQYYENNKEKIIERVKNYNKTNNYKPSVSSEKKRIQQNGLLKKKRKR